MGKFHGVMVMVSALPLVMMDNKRSAWKLRRKLVAIYFSLLRHMNRLILVLFFRILTFCLALKIETSICKRCRTLNCLQSKIFVHIIFS